MKKILLLGKEGQIGWELQRTLATLGIVKACSRHEIDLLDIEQLRAAIRAFQPQIIVNAAAYTAVDLAEKEQALAYKINVQAPQAMAEEAKKMHAWLVHYSTDYVFDGAARRPYDEEGPTHPLNIYGQTKRQGEQAIEAIGGNYLILRTAWIYGWRGKNFLKTLLKMAKKQDSINIVNDQVGCPTWSRLVAEATAQLVVCLQHVPSGIYHMSCGGEVSRYAFSQEVFAHFSPGIAPVLHPIDTKDFPTPARRPPYSALSQQKLYKMSGIQLPHWKTALEMCLEEMNSNPTLW